MKISEVIPAFLAACPSMAPAWQEHLRSWRNEPDRGHFNDAGVVAHHLVHCIERGNTSEFRSAFALLERCMLDGDEGAKEIAITGIIEDIQNIASHGSPGPAAFMDWLGPESRKAWVQVGKFWGQVAKAKEAGLLQSPTSEVAALIADPGKIKNSSLRQMLQRIVRRWGNE